MSIRTKILGFVVIACMFCTLAAVLVGRARLDHDLELALVEKSEAILTRLESTRAYVAKQGLLESSIKEAVRRHPSGTLSDETKQTILNVVPIYAALKVGSDNAQKDHYKFRVAAKEARRPENEATGKEIEFLDQFEADASLKQLAYLDKENKAVWVMRPIRLSQNDGCISCHGHPSTSPWGNGKDILGYKMENWKDGYLHGMFKIVSSTEPKDAEVAAATVNMGLWSSGILICALAVVIVLLRKPIRTLVSITDRLKASAGESLKSSERLGDAAQAVSAATGEQAAGVQETMSSMSEMNAMIAKTLELASQTQSLSSELDQQSKAGTGVMHGMVSSMESIKKSNEELKKMVQIINDISTKTNVINDIVFKTQLLSVNASIEAARAGEHGKGFAVVAEEVGNLALVSGKAAEEIREMLAKSQSHVQEIVAMTSDRVAEGERVSQNAMKSFEEISGGINRIQNYAQSVSEATNQQQEGITQITVAMNQMDRASQQNSEMATNVAQLSTSVLDQSQGLSTITDETENLVFGRVSGGPISQHSAIAPADKKRPVAHPKAKSLGSIKNKLAQKVATKPKQKGLESSNSDGGELSADSGDFRSDVA
jgi:methyl-accepting chemotaxis protein